MIRNGLLVAVALLVFACSQKPVVNAVPEEGSAATVPESVCAAKPSSTNVQDEENRAWRECRNPGWLVLFVRDIENGEPITDADYYALRFALEEERIRKSPTMVRRVAGPESESGIYRWKLAEGWHELRISAHEYRNKWTPTFRIERGKETRIEMEMRKANILKVTVLDEKGELFGDCGVSLRGDGYRAGMHIENGVGERHVPVDEITIIVGDTFLKDYALQTVIVPLKPGIVNEVTVRLRR